MKSCRGIAIRPGVVRFRYDGGNGWFARITRQGKTRSKLFSTATYGGVVEALKRANRWRAKMERELGAPSRRGPHEVREPGSWTITRRAYTAKGRDGQPYDYDVWEVVYYSDWGTRLTRRWGCRKHGPIVAKRLARRWAVEQSRKNRSVDSAERR